MSRDHIKVDQRLVTLIENGVKLSHRSLFIITGDKAKDQVPILHSILSKAVVRARPTVLWCYKKELGFSSHRQKRIRQIKKKNRPGEDNINTDNYFESFIGTTNIRYCYYRETHKILGNTYGMCVLQDFEALTPNLLARTIETVEGGGMILVLLSSIKSKKQFCTMAMDVHARYRTDAHSYVVNRFNERFLLSLVSCKDCLILDDTLKVLPFSSHSLKIEPVTMRLKDATSLEKKLKELKESLEDSQPVGSLVNCCKTLDQAKTLLKFTDAISEKTLRSTVALTAARGRGKSAALGLAVSAAIAFSYSNIFITSPSPENLTTLFEFIFKGFKALDYEEHLDYEVIRTTDPELNKAVIRVNIFRDHRQTIQYIHPSDSAKLGQAELVVIDEAAAIPLPLVKKLLGPYLVFMASTINGYEGTGRSLSLKLIQELREKVAIKIGITNSKKSNFQLQTSEQMMSKTRTLYELELNESIRYRPGDNVEKWLNKILCLDATLAAPLTFSSAPRPEDCDLYYINRDTLFSYTSASELFLYRLMSLYVASHYKNTPDDLQLMSDAPAHHLFCLLGPVNQSHSNLPEILCIIQVCLEGDIAKETLKEHLERGKSYAGNMIPWTITGQFGEEDFASLSGARIVRIATHPEYQGKGYGSRAMKILYRYYSGAITCLDGTDEDMDVVADENEDMLLHEQLTPRKSLPPLLKKLSERPAEKLDYLGVSYGLTGVLLRFWKKAGFVPIYVCQKKNELTGEYSCIMLQCLQQEGKNETSWLKEFWKDFRCRFLNLLGFSWFQELPISTALDVVQNNNINEDASTLSSSEIDEMLSILDIKRLEEYANSLSDCRKIHDLVPRLAKLYFQHRLGNVRLNYTLSKILLGVGLQYKVYEEISSELGEQVYQILGLFVITMKKIFRHLNSVKQSVIENATSDIHKVGKEEAEQHSTKQRKMQKRPVLEDSQMSTEDTLQDCSLQIDTMQRHKKKKTKE